MKCAIYTRVSTDEQGTSIINQQEYFKDYSILIFCSPTDIM